MREFEYILLCLLIPVIYVRIYIAGKYDILSLICKMLDEQAKNIKKKRMKRCRYA